MSLRRRGRDDEAAAEAIDAAQRWPGAVRAAVIVADKAIEVGMPEVALDMATAARESGGVDSAPMARRHELVNRVVDARLLLGNLAGAVAEALVIVEEQGSLDAWPAMLEAAVDDTEQLTLVLGLALLSDGTDFLRAAASTLRPDKTAELCLAYLMAGGRNPDAVTTGVLAAVLRDRADLALLLVEHADLLEPDVRERLAEQLRGAGATAAADRLEQRNDLAFS